MSNNNKVLTKQQQKTYLKLKKCIQNSPNKKNYNQNSNNHNTWMKIRRSKHQVLFKMKNIMNSSKIIKKDYQHLKNISSSHKMNSFN